MKKPLLFLTLLMIGATASAQKIYFAYFQSEDQTPFYIKIKDKVYNSASAGYLTISNLRDTSYNFLIGFSSNPTAEKRFTIKVDGSDLGLTLKNMPDGPEVTDMYKGTSIAADGEAKSNVVYEDKTDPFSKMLSKAADDPSLMKKAVVVQPKPEEKPATPATPVKTDVTVTAEKPAVVEEPQRQPVENTTASENKEISAAHVDAPPVSVALEQSKSEPSAPADIAEPQGEFRRSQVRRYSETSTTEGFGIVYYDRTEGGSTDTIRLLISNPKVIISQKEAPKPGEPFFLEPKAAEKKAVDPEPQKTSTQKNEVADAKPVRTEDHDAASSPAITNPTCASLAAEKDFLKLRRNMAGRESDEAMIDEAKKSFRKQCFTVEQIRYLSALFLTSAGKYQFFDAAYEYASDKSNFSTLQSEIRDTYYLKRFKALVGE